VVKGASKGGVKGRAAKGEVASRPANRRRQESVPCGAAGAAAVPGYNWPPVGHIKVSPGRHARP